MLRRYNGAEWEQVNEIEVGGVNLIAGSAQHTVTGASAYWVAADELLRDASSVRSPALPQLEEVLAGCSEGQCRVILAVARAARAVLKEQEESLP